LKDREAVHLLFGVGIVAAIIGIALWVNDGPAKEVSNSYALVIEAGIAFVLAGAFYKIQNRNSERRKAFWVNEAISQLQSIKSSFSEVRDFYQGVVPEVELPYSYGVKDHAAFVDKVAVPRLQTAMTQIADLLDDPALFHVISKDNYYRFGVLKLFIPDEKIVAKHVITACNFHIKDFEKYIERLKSEIPKTQLRQENSLTGKKKKISKKQVRIDIKQELIDLRDMLDVALKLGKPLSTNANWLAMVEDESKYVSQFWERYTQPKIYDNLDVEIKKRSLDSNVSTELDALYQEIKRFNNGLSIMVKPNNENYLSFNQELAEKLKENIGNAITLLD
jgi:predicted transcriptional regulator